MQQSNQKPIKQVIKILIKAMNDHDPDVAEMTAKDLCKYILQGAIDLKVPENKEIAKSITEEYLKQVGSYNFVIHSAAIRCLAQIVPKLGKQELIYVLKSTINSITDPNIQGKRMEVFSSSASTMINLAPGELGIQLSSLFVECVNQFFKLNSKETNKQQDEVIINLLHLIIDFTQKWPDVVGNQKIKYDRQLLIKILLSNLENSSSKLQLSRKSDVALEKLAAIFDKNNFQFALQNKQYGILNFINQNNNASEELQLKKLRNGIGCLNHLVHAYNRQLKPWVKQITKICVDIVNKYKSFSENIVLASQILQNSIDCLISLLKAYSSELTQYILTPNYIYLCSFLEQTLNYDLQGMMEYLNMNQVMQQEGQQQEEYYTEGTFCWKVRQISLNYTTMLMRKSPQFKQKKGKTLQFLDLLSSKLIQKNQNVTKKAFACFNFIIESISTNKKSQQGEEGVTLRRVKSNQGNFALNLIQKISNKIEILFHHKKTQQEAKTQAAKTLSNLIELLNDIIKDNQQACYKILNLIQQLLPKVKTDSCIFLIKSSKTLINGMLPYQKTIKMVDSYLKMSKSNNYKIVAASFDGLRNALKYYWQPIQKTGKINQIMAILLPKLKEHDADKLVKIQAMRCLGPIFINILAFLPQKSQTEILQATQNKMKIEIDKTVILTQIARIPQNFNFKKPEQQQILKNLLQICSATIGNSNYELSNLSASACDRLIRLLKKSLNQKNADLILDKCRPLLIEQKIPKFLDILIQNFPTSLKNYSESIVKAGDNYYIKKLIQKKIITPQKSIQVLKNTVNPQNIKKLSIILSQIHPQKDKLINQINQTRWGLVCMSALGYLGDLSTIEKIQKIMNNAQQNHDMKFEGARSIGNIASRYPQFGANLIQLSKQPNQGYLYLHALKQMLGFSQKQFPGMEDIIRFIFSKSQESDKQTNKHLLAECIGNVIKISPKEQKKILDSVKDMNPSRRYIVASSLRYALEGMGKQSIIQQSIDHFIQKVCQLTKDVDVNVRQGALKSLNSIIQTHAQCLRHYIDKSFMQSLFNSMTIKPQLIKIIDYGVSKEKKDLGKGLRIQAFNFLKSNLLTRQVEPYYEPIVGKCLQKINEETTNDLVLKRVSIIRIICQKDYTAFVPHQNQFSSKLGTDGVLKPYCSVTSNNDQRSQGYLKGLFKQILTITNLSTERSQSIRAMINKVETFQRLKKIMEIVRDTL